MIRRFLTRILMVILIAFCGYNWLQVQTLQRQVRDLQTRLTIRENRPQATADWAQQAEKHAGLAQTALSRADWRTAQRELQQGIGDLKNAPQPSPEVRRDLTTLEAVTKQVQQQVGALWRKRERPLP